MYMNVVKYQKSHKYLYIIYVIYSKCIYIYMNMFIYSNAYVYIYTHIIYKYIHIIHIYIHIIYILEN